MEKSNEVSGGLRLGPALIQSLALEDELGQQTGTPVFLMFAAHTAHHRQMTMEPW